MRPNAKRSFSFLRVILGALAADWHRDCLRCREDLAAARDDRSRPACASRRCKVDRDSLPKRSGARFSPFHCFLGVRSHDELDQRIAANLEVALKTICRKLPNGGDHETRKRVAEHLLEAAQNGHATLASSRRSAGKRCTAHIASLRSFVQAATAPAPEDRPLCRLPSGAPFCRHPTGGRSVQNQSPGVYLSRTNTERDSSRPRPLKIATVTNASIFATDVADARGRSLAIAAFTSFSV
jgi:hypothetical protein